MKFDLSQIELSCFDINKGLALPTQASKKLAEFFGIIAGDGWVSFNSKQVKNVVAISGDEKVDIPYLKGYVTPLIKELFNLKVPIHHKPDKCEIYFSSKGVLNFLRKQDYYKHNHEPLKIPNWILEDGLYFQYFIKGLADTDFSFYFIRRKTKRSFPIIELTSIYNNLILKVDEWLKSKGFKTYVLLNRKRVNKKKNRTTYESIVRLVGHNNFTLWMELISFRNKRHLDKIIKVRTREIS